MSETPPFTLEHAYLSEADALRLLAGRRLSSGHRMLDPKAQVVGEFGKQIRPPHVLPASAAEAREQMAKLVALMDEPPPALARIENLSCPGPAGPIALRLYSPTPKGTALPLVCYLHGGGWVQGNLESHHGCCGKLAAWANVMVVAIDYRLAPEHKFPAGVEDAVAAVRWLRDNAASLGADGKRLAVAGDSAGGNLAAVVCQQLAAKGEPSPQAQVLIYPAVDFAMDLPSHAEMREGYIIPRNRMDWYKGHYLRGEADALDVRASPLLAGSLKGQPPAMIVTAGFDPLRDEGKAYADKLAADGVAVVYREWPGQIHGFTILTRVIPQGNECLREIAGYLKRNLNG
ncbi:MAG: alpha/beta hydrolase [Alphaproteobacteria bacterium]|nr:alpha/beta hydrolase [Alphaproteobacteria bacterium]